MKYTDILRLWPLLKPFTPACLQPLLSALVSGAEEVAAAEARRIARSRQTAQAVGAAAKASSDSTTRAREQAAGAAAAASSRATERRCTTCAEPFTFASSLCDTCVGNSLWRPRT